MRQVKVKEEEPSDSTFAPGAFTNIGRYLSGSSPSHDEHAIRSTRGGSNQPAYPQLSESAPVPPSHVKRPRPMSDSFQFCGIRPQDLLPRNQQQLQLEDSIEDLEPGHARRRGLVDSFPPPSTCVAGGGWRSTPSSPALPDFPIRRLDLSGCMDLSASQIEGITGDLSFPSSLSPPSNSPVSGLFSHHTGRKASNLPQLIGRLWTDLKHCMQHLGSMCIANSNTASDVDDEQSSISSMSSASSPSKVSKEWCFVLGIALGFCCFALVVPRPSWHFGSWHFGSHSSTRWMDIADMQFTDAHKGSSDWDAEGVTMPSKPFSLLPTRKSQQIIKKPVLTSPSPTPGPAGPGESLPKGNSLLEFLRMPSWNQDGMEITDYQTHQRRASYNRTEIILAKVVEGSKELLHAIGHGLCTFLVFLLKRLPFMPKRFKEKRWC